MVWNRQDLTRHGGQPAWFATTTNRGRTWSKPKIIYDPTAQGGSTLVDIFLYAAIGLIPPDDPGPLITQKGYFLGDYMGQAAVRNTVLALTTATTAIPGNQQNEYFQRITGHR